MKTTHPFLSTISSVLVGVLLFTQTAIAQDPSAAATQAAQQAAMASQQAAQQAAQANQQAAQQAAQAAADAATQSSSSYPFPGRVIYPPAPQVPGGPLPAAIANAHTILLTNAGMTQRLGLDANTFYNDVHQRLESWGYYQLVSTPQQADLVFQLDEIDPRNGGYVTPATDIYNRTPSFRIVILDAKSGVPLWTVTAPIYITDKKTYAHWIDVSETGLITRLKALAHQPISPEEQAALTEFPKTTSHVGLVLGLALGVPAAIGVGMFFLARHEANNMKEQQDAFCKANNIPLSMCAGG